MTKEVLSTNIIDRKAAAKLLKTSIRTIDRYRQRGTLSTVLIDNGIYLKKEEIEEFLSRQNRHRKKEYITVDTAVDREDRKEDKRDDTIKGRHEHEMDIAEYYQKMYQELLMELKEKQTKLEGAHYRVGQLEAELRLSVPLSEYKEEKRLLLEQGTRYQKALNVSEETARRLQKVFQIERLNKRIYLAIVLGLILLQPLWLFLSR